MFCRNCGEEYTTDEAILCTKCGAAKGTGNLFCPNCGHPTNPESTVCLNCGIALGNPNAKSKLTAGLLGIFLGWLGVHNFYLGYTNKAIPQLVLGIVGLLLSCCFGLGAIIIFGVEIWGLIEGIMILTGTINRDADGNPLSN